MPLQLEDRGCSNLFFMSTRDDCTDKRETERCTAFSHRLTLYPYLPVQQDEPPRPSAPSISLGLLFSKLRRCLGWEHDGTRQLIAAEVLARTAKHVLACRLRRPCVFGEEEGDESRGSGKSRGGGGVDGQEGEEEDDQVCNA